MFRLQDNPIYEAISYTWADESGIVTFRQPFHQTKYMIMKTQATARRHYADFEMSLTQNFLWVDLFARSAKTYWSVPNKSS